MLDVAIAITSEAFRGKFDKGGKPYILHCLRVMNGVIHLGEDHACVAIMHDLIEDTKYTAQDLYDLGFNSDVVNNVVAMTHIKGVPYSEYVMEISKFAIATEVKKSDLKDNSDITRLKGITEKDTKRMEKYHKAYTFLTTGSGY